MSDIITAIESASEADLDEIDDRIGELESQLATMKAAKRIIETRLGVAKAPRRAASSNGAGNATKPKVRELVFDLIEAEGPGTKEQITQRLKAKGHKVTLQGVNLAVAKCDWFEIDTATGRVVIARAVG